MENLLKVARALGVLDQLVSSVDPYSTDVGRLRADEQRSASGGLVVEQAARKVGPRASWGAMDFLLGVRDDLRQGALRFRLPDGAEARA